MTFKELLDQCSWEDLEDFLYEFPDVGMDEGRWKMEGFRRMYDELRRMTPQASAPKAQGKRLRLSRAVHQTSSQFRVSVCL